jgi:23S rRNA pseudouridine1911/1915/1917 synthase
MEFLPEGPLEPRILHEDAAFLAVYKPHRMHSAPGLGGGDLCEWVFERFPEAREAGGGGGARPAAEGGLLHRLDYETSGLVLFARSAEAFRSLIAQQERGSFRKEYLAFSTASREEFPAGSLPRRGIPSGIAEAAWTRARESVDGRSLASLLRVEGGEGPPVIASSFRAFGPRGSRVSCLVPGEAKAGKGKPSYSSSILECSASSSHLRLRIALSRGFRHQIRAQLSWIGLPILGDSLYGGEPDGRLRLYAVALAFAHPLSGEAVILSADESIVAFEA